MRLSEQERGFLAHIADNPFDDSVRLIYSDWLEERGDPRANLIRLQIEHAHVNLDWLGSPTHPDEPDANDLQDRIDDLIRCHWRDWHADVPPQIAVDFTGGLLAVTIRKTESLLDPGADQANVADVDELKAWWRIYRPWIGSVRLCHADDNAIQRLVDGGWLDGISRLEVRESPITKWSMGLIGQLTSLRDLSVAQLEIGEPALNPLRKLVGLQRLNIGRARIRAQGLGLLTKLPALRHLVLDWLPLNSDARDHLSGLQQLESLSCASTALPDRSLSCLRELTNLRRLNLLCQHLVGDELHLLKGLTQLEEISLETNVLHEAGWQTLGQLSNLRRIRGVGRGTLDWSAEHVRGLPNLEVLALDDMGITDEAALHLGQLPSLRVFRAQGKSEQLTRRGLKRLCQTGSIESLQLRGLEADWLPELATLPRLRKLAHPPTSGLDQLPVLPNLTDLDLRLAVVDLATLRRQPRLARLRVIGPGGALQSLVGLTALPLRRLWLHHVYGTASDFAFLSTLTGLEELRITATTRSVSGGFCQFLTGLPRLTTLRMMHGSIWDDHLHLLASCPALDTLSLGQVQITDEEIADLARIPNLRVVSIQPLSDSEDSLKALQRTRRVMVKLSSDHP